MTTLLWMIGLFTVTYFVLAVWHRAVNWPVRRRKPRENPHSLKRFVDEYHRHRS